MLALLEAVFGVLEFFEAWRFFLCVFLALALVGFIYWQIPDQRLCLALAAPVVVIGIGAGIVWQGRRRVL